MRTGLLGGLPVLICLVGCMQGKALTTFEAACRDLSHADAARQDQALATLGDVMTWKSYRGRDDARLAFCIPATARLLQDPDEPRRDRAARVLDMLVSMLGPRRATETVPLVRQDVERLWARYRRVDGNEEDSLRSLAVDLRVLTKYGPEAHDVLPIVTEILEDATLHERAEDGERDERGWYRHSADLYAALVLREADELQKAIHGGRWVGGEWVPDARAALGS